MTLTAVRSQPTSVICFSHLRWDFVYQRPQHLMSRLARRQPVLYVEEPVPTDGEPRLEARLIAPNLRVIVPHLPAPECAVGDPAGERRQAQLLDRLLEEEGISEPILWYYTPMSLGFSEQLPASLVVYDCMDELSNFLNPPKQLVAREKQLLARADLVFTGGHSLYEAKRSAHAHVHAFPSSVDVAHFAAARQVTQDPSDVDFPSPRIGFYGVIDERFDAELLRAVAAARPDWHWVMLGPVVKIDPQQLPQAANIHWLGGKRYEELPAYLGSWDVAMMPFALNASTRFISPTKTPEYLAGGCPVVSTPIADVVASYGDSGLVHIADGPQAFVAAIDRLLGSDAPARSARFCAQADALLKGLSWDRTCSEMTALMEQARTRRESSSASRPAPQAQRQLEKEASAWTA